MNTNQIKIVDSDMPQNKIQSIIKTAFKDNWNSRNILEADIKHICDRENRLVQEITETKSFYQTIIKNEKMNMWFDRISLTINKDFSNLLKEYGENVIENNAMMLEHVKLVMKSTEIDGRKITERELYEVFDKNQDRFENRLLSLDTSFNYENFNQEADKYQKKIRKLISRNAVFKWFSILLPWILLLLMLIVSVIEFKNSAQSLLSDSNKSNFAKGLYGSIKLYYTQRPGGFNLDAILYLLKSIFSYFGVFTYFILIGYVIYVKMISILMKNKLLNKIAKLSLEFYNNHVRSNKKLEEEFFSKADEYAMRLEEEYIRYFRDALNI